MKRISFVESTVGTVKSIYRRKLPDGKSLCVSIKMTNCKRVWDSENNADEHCKFLVTADQIENLNSILNPIKRGSVITIKETNNTIIKILEGEHIPKKGIYECLKTDSI